MGESENFRKVAEKPFETVARQAAGTAAFAVPVGKGVGLLAGGAVSGGLFAASEEEAGIKDIAFGAGTGGVAAPISVAGGKLLQKVVGKGASSAAKVAKEAGKSLEPTVQRARSWWTDTAEKGITAAASNIKSGWRLSQKLAKNPNLVEWVAQKADDWRLEAPYKLMAQNVQKAQGVLTEFRKKTLSEGTEQSIDISPVREAVREAWSNSTRIIGEGKNNEQSKLSRLITGRLYEEGPDLGIDKATPNQLFRALQDIEKDLRNHAVKSEDTIFKNGDPVAGDLFEVYNVAKQKILDVLDDKVDVNLLDQFKREAADKLRKISPSMADELLEHTSVKDVRKFMQFPLVELDRYLASTRSKGFTAGELGRIFRPVGLAAAGLVGAAIHPGAILLAAPSVFTTATTFLGKEGLGTALSTKAIRNAASILSRDRNVLAKLVPGHISLPILALEKVPNGVIDQMPNFMSVLSTAAVLNYQKDKGELKELEQAQQQDLLAFQDQAAGDEQRAAINQQMKQQMYQTVSTEVAKIIAAYPDSAAAIKTAFEIWTSGLGIQEDSSLSAAQQTQYAEMEAAKSMVDQLGTELEEIGMTGFGPLSGILGAGKTLAGKARFSDTVRTFNDSLRARATVLAKAFGEVRPTDEDIDRFVSAMPTVYDSREVAERKMENIRRQLQEVQGSLLQATQLGGGGGGFDTSEAENLFQEQSLGFGP